MNKPKIVNANTAKKSVLSVFFMFSPIKAYEKRTKKEPFGPYTQTPNIIPAIDKTSPITQNSLTMSVSSHPFFSK